MSGGYQAYGEYKESGVEWLGEIPIFWEIISLKNIAVIATGSTPRSDVEIYWDGDINWVTPTDLSQKTNIILNESKRKITLKGLDSCGTTLVPMNSVILSTRAPIGSLAIIGSESCTNQGCKAIVTDNKNISMFLYYYFSVLTAPLNNLGRGSTFLELSTEDLCSFKIAFPKTDVGKIISFLDHETAKIDTLIEKQNQLIELLKEKRQAVISHAVTKGLNPDAPMKDSGIEWLGEVPEHWVTSKFSFLKSVLTDYTANGSFADLKSNAKYLDEPSFARLVRLTDLRHDLNNNGVWISENSYYYLNKSALFGGEFLLADVGAHAGLFYQMPFDKGYASLAPNMFMARFISNKVSRKFMAYTGQSQSVACQLKLRATASAAQPKINKDDFKSVVCAYPDIIEQNKIVYFLKMEIEKIDALIEKQHKFIELIKERRTALISAAVTGKIDVRHWRAPQVVSESKIPEATA